MLSKQERIDELKKLIYDLGNGSWHRAEQIAISVCENELIITKQVLDKFCEWATNNGYIKALGIGSKWFNYSDDKDVKKFTTAQLYELYLQSKTK